MYEELKQRYYLQLLRAYSAYVQGYRESYVASAQPIIGLCAFVLIHKFGVSRKKVRKHFAACPDLEQWDRALPFLNTLSSIELRVLAYQYDAYIISLDEMVSGSCPVCLNEYLDCEYANELHSSIYKQIIGELILWFSENIVPPGSVNDTSLRRLRIISRFAEMLREEVDIELDGHILKALFFLMQEHCLVTKVLEWTADMDIGDTDDEAFRRVFHDFCSQIVTEYKPVTQEV